MVDISGKRKRGRPTGSITTKGRPGLKPVRRTRARAVTRRAKINPDETIDDFSDENGTGAAESNETPLLEVHDDDINKVQETHEAGSSNTELDLQDGKADKDHLDVHKVEEDKKEDASEKLEQMVDPLHAMLLDMIPTLSQKNVETSTSTLRLREKNVETSTSVPECEKTQPVPGANQVKKKVSYKDVAGELLKDW